MIVRLICVFLASGTLASALLGQASSVDDRSVDDTEQPKTDEVTRPPQVSVGMVPSGIGRYSAGQWGAMALVGGNSTDQDAEEIVSIYVGDDPGQQYSRQFWVPAGSKRQTWVPVKVPDSIPQKQSRVDVSMMRLVETPTGEVFTNHATGEAILQRSFMLTPREVNTAIVLDAKSLEQSQQLNEEGDRLRAFIDLARDSVSGLRPEYPLISLNANFIPPTYEALQELDQMVIAGDALAGDTLGIGSVRRWLRSGGRLWVMLDRTSPMMVDQLLGADGSCEIIDRVQLNAYQMEVLNAMPSENAVAIDWDSEIPSELTRIVTNAEEIAYSIEGWPAAFWLPVGDGEVLMTTLSVNGWRDSRGAATQGLSRLSRRFFEPRAQPVDCFEAMQPLLDSKIGYQIPQRYLVAGILGGNILLLLLLGAWWARTRRLERFAFALPVISLVSAFLFVAMAWQNTGAVPSTIATAQLISVDRATGQMDVVAGHAVFSQASGELNSIANGDTVVLPRGDDASTSYRLTLDDGIGTRLKGAKLRPGAIRYFESKTSLVPEQPILVRGSFDSQGFVGSLLGMQGQVFEDAFVSAPRVPPLGLTFSSQGDEHLVRGPHDALFVRDQFVSGRLLSDEQRLRQQFMKDIFGDLDRYPFAKEPMAVFWTNALEMGLEGDSQFTSVGSAAVAAPIVLQSPDPGASFLVPSTFIRLEPVAGEEGVSSIYNPRTGRWLKDVTKENAVDFLACFPDVTAGMELERFTITIKINAPTRNLVVKSMVDGRPTAMMQSQSPTGTVRCVIDQSEALQWHSKNRLWFQIAVTGSTDLGEDQDSSKAYQVTAEELERRERRSETGVITSGSGTAREVNSVSWTIDDVHVEAMGRLVK